MQFGCATEGQGTSVAQQGWPIYITKGQPAFKAFCGDIEYTSEASCKGGEGSCSPGSASCQNFSQIGNGPIYSTLDANYTPQLVTQATQAPFDGQPSTPSYGALNNTVSDVEEFGNECIHKHFVPFNQDAHTFQVITTPTYIPAGEIESTITIDVKEENKADSYIQPFLVQEFLIKY